MELISNNSEPKPFVRCDECDTEVDHYVTFVTPTNDIHNVCWSCQERDDKGINQRAEWKRGARQREINTMTEKE